MVLGILFKIPFQMLWILFGIHYLQFGTKFLTSYSVF
ncbi:ORF196 [Staphylococcus phage EW]|uniref:ORF196 n=1 Tax=Staphylococcus phage EW TaxID=2936814 RepID=Q4ZC59_9CAUD|nr:ORF196 [Staphylococcus phage EW]AAX91415.1 ORF196 [Staphylococcus phage EW]